MWKVVLIFVLAIPAAFALEQIRKEVHAMRVQKGKAKPETENKDEKFDNWYMDNEELMQQEKDKQEQKKIAKLQKKEAKAQKRAEKQKDTELEI